MAERIFKSNHIVTPSGVFAGYIRVVDGVISALTASPPADVTGMIDCGDLFILPGIVDPHVHINEPGRTEWEGFETATRAALAGGVTTLVDMPLNASPVTTTVAAYQAKLRATENKLYAHCGFWGGVVPGNEHQLVGLAKAGVLGYKAFLTHSGIDEFPNVTEADLDRAMPVLAKLGMPLLVHCEVTAGNHTLTGDPSLYQNYLNSRPRSWENEAIACMIRLCEKHQCPVHIVHLSSADSLEQIKAAKHRGLPLSVETAPHYLYFGAETIPAGDPSYKCAPPIRERANNEQLWMALRSGIIDFIATDHSPAPPEMKCRDTGDFGIAWGGIASLQLSLPVTWTLARQHGDDINTVVRWLCEFPARLPGLGNRKGKIEPGFDADLVVFDPEARFEVAESMILHRHKATPYLGASLFGMVSATYLAGELVYDGASFAPPRGRIIQSTSYE